MPEAAAAALFEGMQQRTLAIFASGLAFLVLVVAALATPQRGSDQDTDQQAGASNSFVEQFTSRYLLAVAQRREVQDYDLQDGRAWARAIQSGAKEKKD
jgi:hypothetical protein